MIVFIIYKILFFIFEFGAGVEPLALFSYKYGYALGFAIWMWLDFDYLDPWHAVHTFLPVPGDPRELWWSPCMFGVRGGLSPSGAGSHRVGVYGVSRLYFLFLDFLWFVAIPFLFIYSFYIHWSIYFMFLRQIIEIVWFLHTFSPYFSYIVSVLLKPF